MYNQQCRVLMTGYLFLDVLILCILTYALIDYIAKCRLFWSARPTIEHLQVMADAHQVEIVNLKARAIALDDRARAVQHRATEIDLRATSLESRAASLETRAVNLEQLSGSHVRFNDAPSPANLAYSDRLAEPLPYRPRNNTRDRTS